MNILKTYLIIQKFISWFNTTYENTVSSIRRINGLFATPTAVTWIITVSAASQDQNRE